MDIITQPQGRPYLQPVGQLSLFADKSRWPHRPYCGEGKAATKIRSLSSALRRPYIQANPPHLRVWSIYDVDRPHAGLAWIDADLPEPAWVSMNRENGHAHLVWGLSAPVLVDSPDMRQEPMRYLCAVEASFREKLGADQGYAGLLTKNPMHPLWHTLVGTRQAYTLAELAQGLDLPKHLPKKNPEQIGLGRNVTLFEWLRQYAYKSIRHYKIDVRDFIRWQQHLYGQAMQRNGDFMVPMDYREVHAIVRSVSRWTWKRFDIAASDARFSQVQAHRGSKGGVASGVARREATRAQRAMLARLAEKGKSTRAMALILGVNQSTVVRWLKSIG